MTALGRNAARGRLHHADEAAWLARRVLAWVAVLVLLGGTEVSARGQSETAASAEPRSHESDVTVDESPSAAFADGVRALRDGRAAAAVAAFEALADRGVIDAAASFDRGLAYATRIRIGAEVPGDLGRAIHGFEEARTLTTDAKLADAASRALIVLRSEVARRRNQAGQSVVVDPGQSLGHALAESLSEETWTLLCAIASVALGVGLFLRWFALSHRARVGGGVTMGIATPVLALAVSMTLAVRHDRLNVEEAVVVVPGAHPTDERGIALAGAAPLPEGARVEVIDARGAATRVRFGASDAYVPAGSLRDLARRP